MAAPEVDIDCRIPDPGEGLASKTVAAAGRNRQDNLNGRCSRRIREQLRD